MKKIVSKMRAALKWYFNEVVTTGAMCPSCMVPANGGFLSGAEDRNVVKNNSKAA